MVHDLHIDLELVVCPIVREADGLALSSRNTYLSSEERKQALILNQSLVKANEAYQEGERDTEKLIQLVTDTITSKPLAKIDYVSIYAYPSLQEIDKIDGSAIIAVAVHFGKTRLIDNIIVEKQ